jgi:hypothetical protein
MNRACIATVDVDLVVVAARMLGEPRTLDGVLREGLRLDEPGAHPALRRTRSGRRSG